MWVASAGATGKLLAAILAGGLGIALWQVTRESPDRASAGAVAGAAARSDVRPDTRSAAGTDSTRAQPDEPEAAAVALAVPEPPAGAEVPSQPDPSVQTGLPDGTEQADATVPAAPRFDVVRITPDGSGVVAGAAEPASKVTIFAGEAPVATVEADPSGQFVAIFRAEPSAEPRALTLGSETADGGRTVSTETVLLLPAAPEADPPVAGAEPPTVAADAPELAAAPFEPASGTAPEPDGGQARKIAATAILRPGAVAVEALPTAEPAPAAGATPQPGQEGEPALRTEVRAGPRPRPGPRQVSLASISYAEEGAVALAGFGTAGAAVRVYVDGAFVKDAVVDPAGRWTLQLNELAAGTYRVRVDEIQQDGTVASRVETRFRRDLPSPAQSDPTAPLSVTVQPGNNLWNIARSHYGRGVLFAQIFTANSGLIRDPDVIYPGQIFVLPEVEGALSSVSSGPRARPLQ